jgi:cytochrome P450
MGVGEQLSAKTERATAPLPQGLELSELDPVYREHPHARLDHLRCEAPHYLDPASEAGRLFLTRHADVRAAITDRSLTRDAKKAYSRGAEAVSDTLLDKDGEDLVVGRMLMARAFDPRAVESRRGLITQVVEDAIAALDNPFDAMRAFAAPIPIRVMTSIFGLPQDNLAEVRDWSEDAAVFAMHPNRTPEQTIRMMTAVAGLQKLVFDTMAARRAEPSDDLLCELILADANGRSLEDSEIAPLCIFGMIAGSLTTTDLIGNTIVMLLRHPEQRARLQDNPGLIAGAVEESLRMEPPVSAVARHVVEDREVLGCPMRAGATIKASLLAGNHDPDLCNDPHAFRIDRPPVKHVSFGGGAHACLGAGLARLEAQIAVQTLLHRFPDLRLIPDDPPSKKKTYGFRGYSRIPLHR